MFSVRRVEITKQQAEALMEKGVQVEAVERYYLHLDTPDCANIPPTSQPPKPQTRAKARREKAPPNAVYIMASGLDLLSLNEELSGVMLKTATTVIAHLAKPENKEGLTADELAQALLETNLTRLAQSQHGHATAKSYVSKLYQAGVLNIKGAN
jgi:hypothetical protein